MYFGQALFLVFVLVGLIALLILLGDYKFVALRPFLAAEGFQNSDAWMPTASGRHPEGEPTGTEESLQGGDVVQDTGLLLVSEKLVPQTTEESSANWSRMTSERCFRSDVGEPLKKTRNFLQRTNNYSRTHPDDCSAPNHEMVGTFYRPHDGVGATPKTGLPLPAMASF